MPRTWGVAFFRPAFSFALSLFTAILHWGEIRSKSPQEHVTDAWWTSTLDPWARTQKVTTPYYRPLFQPPAYRTIRVKLFSGSISRMMDDACLFADFYLDDVGNLSLKLVRGRWNLDSIQIVYYTPETGLKVFIPRNLELLPAKQVESLKGHDGCIRIIEVPTKAIQQIRQHRLQLLEYASYVSLAYKCLKVVVVTAAIAFFVHAYSSGRLNMRMGVNLWARIVGLYHVARSFKALRVAKLLQLSGL